MEEKDGSVLLLGTDLWFKAVKEGMNEADLGNKITRTQFYY